MKKFLFMLLAALTTITSSLTLVSCSSEDDEPTDVVSAYTIMPTAKFEGIDEETQKMIDEYAGLKPITVETTELQAKVLIDTVLSTMKTKLLPLTDELEPGQKLTFIVDLYKGTEAKGKPIYTKQIVITKGNIQ